VQSSFVIQILDVTLRKLMFILPQNAVESEEVEVNVEKLDDKSLRKLEKYAKKNSRNKEEGNHELNKCNTTWHCINK